MPAKDNRDRLLAARTRANLILCARTTVVFTVICGLGGYYVATSYDVVAPVWGAAQGTFIALVIGGSNSIIYTFYLEGPGGLWVRRMPFLAVVTVRSLVTLFIVMASIRLAPLVFPPLSDGVFNWFDRDTFFAVVASCFAIFCFSLMTEISHLLGQGVLGNFFRGRYHQPREENLTFLYIDIIGSTGIAERVGPMAFHAMLDTFARDLSDIVLECGGKIHKYVGDGIMITWAAGESATARRAIDCYFMFKEKIEGRRDQYISVFGQCPEFRGALHGGPVVVGEMGDLKREIVYLGDTVNTTARILSLAGERGEDLLVSSDILKGAALPDTLTAEALGATHLRGRVLPIELSAVSLKRVQAS